MTKTIYFINSVKFIFLVGFFLMAVASAQAATPVLSLSNTGNNSVQVSVSGADAFMSVIFYYNASSSAQTGSNIGVTDMNGSFYTTLSNSAYNINSNYPVYVVVNGLQSINQSWPITTATGNTLLFSSTAPIVNVGQNLSIIISGGGGNYYINTNSNPSAVSLSLTGNTITMTGLANGISAISVCSAPNVCGTINATVGGATGGNSSTSQSAVTFGTVNPTLTLGSHTTIPLSGSKAYYVASNSNINAVEGEIQSGQITLYAIKVGSASLNICASDLSGCGTLVVTVINGTSTAAVTPVPVQTTTTTPIPILPPVQNYSQAPNPSFLAAIQTLQTQLAQILTQIQAMTATLNQLAASANLTATTPLTSNSTAVIPSALTQFLNSGSSGPEVTLLQQKLKDLGFYSGSVTGYYGALTVEAVKKYQSAHNLETKGYVGPATRAALDAGN